MYRKNLLAISLALATTASCGAQTIEGIYKGLSSGPLKQAKLVKLPTGTLLRAGTLRISAQQVNAELAKSNPTTHTQIEKNRFFLLEQLATRLLLGAEARAWSKQNGKAFGKEVDDAAIRAYLQSVSSNVSVSDKEASSYYVDNKDMFSGAAYANIASELKSFLMNEKRQKAVTARIDTLSQRNTVEVDAVWCRAQSAQALNNTVDRARRSGKPALVDFGSTGCRPCDMLAPILDELRKTYAGKCSVQFVQVSENPILAARYGIQSIPVQVFFDGNGNEVYRHVGFFPKNQIVARLAAMGVK